MANTDLRRVSLVRRAFILETLTIAWVLVEAGVALGSAIEAHSLTLMAFGVDSVIELLSALVLLWRLRVELHLRQEFSETVERRASLVAGALLAALTLYVIVSAGWGLWTHHSEAVSVSGLILAAVAIPVMFGLARTKIRIANQIGSAALRADAIESVACGYFSAVVLIGLLAQWLLGAWWVDSVSALVLVPFLVHETQEAWEDRDAQEGQ